MARPSPLPQIQRKDVLVPADVPPEARQTYIDNLLAATRGTGRLMLLEGTGPQEVQTGKSRAPEGDGNPGPALVAGPEALFALASTSSVGLLAIPLGWLTRYGSEHADCNYLVRLNDPSIRSGRKGREAFFNQLWSVEQVLDLIDFTKWKIRAVGYSLHLGSEYEADTLQQAAQVAIEAHSTGLLVVFWVHTSGKSPVNGGYGTRLVEGCGLALALGADFVVIGASHPGEDFLEAALDGCRAAAGRTGVVATGGGSADPRTLLEQAHELVNSAGLAGYSMGPVVHSLPDDRPSRLTEALAAIVLGGHDVARALQVYEGTEQFKI